MRIFSHSHCNSNWNCNSSTTVASSSVYSVVSLLLLLLLSGSSSINNQATTSVQAQAQAQRHQLRGAIGDQRSLLVESAAAATATSTSLSTNHFSTRENNSSNNNKANKINNSSPILVPLRESSSSLSSLSSSFTSSNTTNDDDDIDSDNEEDSCLVESVCSIPELETLCGLMMSLALPLSSNDDDNNSNSNNTIGSHGFLFSNNNNTHNNINTFFAPNNDVFSSLPQLVANDVTTNQDIFRNVLMYHAVVDDVDNNDIPIDVNELVCNEELVMMNQETTKTLCRIIDGDDEKGSKIQLGVGNRPMRSLPMIVQGNIEACDGTIFIHVVNQVILPVLPLSSSSSFSNANTNTNEEEEEDDDDEEGTATSNGTIDVDDENDEDKDADVDLSSSSFSNSNEAEEKEEGTAIIDGRIDADNDNNDEGEEKNHNGVNKNNCGGIFETVCSLSGLETLCDYLQLLQNENDHGLEFLSKSGGTFFAPLNIAFARLPSHIFLDLQDSSILANVLEYHAVRKRSSTDSWNTNTNTNTAIDTATNTPDGSNTLLFVDELVCEQELVMMNSKTTRTLCLAGKKKGQVGFGNMPMRTLPKILPVRSDIVTCDRTGIIHLVDQVILPGLPLSGSSSFGSSSGSGGLIEIIPPPDENENENNNIGSLPEEAMVEDIIENDELPTQKPPSSLSPSDFNIYSVENTDVDTTTTTTTTTTNRFDDVRDGKNIAGRGQLSTECPQYVEPAGPCLDTYVSNLVCKYDYIQLGCSWEELRCLPIMRCECNQFNDGNWACRTDSMMGCDTATTPPDFPSGKVCNPDDDKWNNGNE